MNLKIDELQKNLYQTISESGLPVGVAYHIVHNLSVELEKLFSEVCAKERQAQEDNSDSEE